MYEAYFNLNQAPFSIAPDPSFLYLSNAHREALAHLMYGFSHGGFVMVTGEVGTGKTTLLRNLLKQTPPDLDVAFILNPRLTVRELLATLCDELGTPYDPATTTTVKQYIDLITRHLLATHRVGRSTVMIIDEAQNLSPAVLEQVRLLTNLETDERKLLRIILIGQPELADLLDRQDLRQLAQRITARYHLGSLNRPDTYAYVMHRMSRAGGSPHTFSQSALRRLYSLSQGTPRLINVIADRALLGAYTEGARQVSAKTVNRAAREVFGKSPDRRRWWIGAAACAGIAGAAWAFLGPQTGSQISPAANEAVSESPAGLSGRADGRIIDPAQAAEPATDDLPMAKDEGTDLASTSSAPRDAEGETDRNPELENPTPANGDAIITPETYAMMQAEADAAVTSAAPASGTATEVSRIERPTGSSFANRRRAYGAIFDRWGVSFDDVDTAQIPCDFAPSAGLQCLSERGDWTEVQRLDLPVILELWDGKAAPYYAALIGMADARIRLQVGNRLLETTQLALRDQWSGSYVVLWQTPPGYYGSLREGQRHETVAWLRQQLGTFIERSLASPRPDLFDANLLEAVQQFQAAEGLLTDGIVGPATWIRLADRLNLPQPSLDS